MIAEPKQYLGTGLYSVPEAALYARVPPRTLARWLFGSRSGQPVVEPQYGRTEKVVSFLDLVQALAVREIRVQRKVPLAKFRQAVQLAKQAFGLDHPFARRHRTYLLGDGLVIRPEQERNEFVEASGRHRGQRLFPFVELYLDRLDFAADGLASRYRIYSGGRGVTVTMDPRTRFGEPLLPSGYTPFALWDAIQSEGGIDPAARAYGVPADEVRTAYQFVTDHLGRAAA